MKLPIHSLRVRLILPITGLLAVVILILGLIAAHLRENETTSITNELLAQRVTALLADMSAPPSPMSNREKQPPPEEPDFNPPPPIPPDDFSSDRESAPPPKPSHSRMPPGNLSVSTLQLFAGNLPYKPYFIIWNSDGSVQRKSANCPTEIARPSDRSSHANPQGRTRGNFKESYLISHRSGCILVGIDMSESIASEHRFVWSLAGFGLLVLALGSLLCLVLVSRLLRPLSAIGKTAHLIANGDLTARIPASEQQSEIGKLAEELNHTFSALEAAFIRQKSFTADASHELRTPLAVIISETQTTLAKDRSSEEYRETVETCLESAQQMRSLIEVMLQLARLDSHGNRIQMQEIDMGALIQDCTQTIIPLATEGGININRNLQPLIVLGDAQYLRQLVLNLLSNAIAYNKAGGEIRVSTTEKSNYAEFSIADNGIGISEEDLPHVFERFYRADKARSRAQGHCGLGLSICKAIVDAHGGTIEVWSKLGIGTCFTLRFPRQ